MNGYELSRNWFDWSFVNPDKIKPNHSALYFFAIEHCNRLGWKHKFGLPTTMAMEAIGIKSYNTYVSTLKDLVEWGFIEMIERSKNQYSSNIVALSNFDKAFDKALDKALIKHSTKQSESTVQSIDSIDKQETNKQLTIQPLNKKIVFNFKTALIDYGFDENLVDEWLQVRKTKKAVNTETAFNSFIREIESRPCDINSMLRIAVERSWLGFKHQWVDNLNLTKQNYGNTETRTAESKFIGRMSEETVKRNLQGWE